MLGITTRTYDKNGFLRTKYDEEGSEIGSITRRVSITNTLDGGVVVEDRGSNKADIEMKISVPYSDVVNEKLRYLIENYSELRVFLRNEFFICVPTSLDRTVTKLKLNLRVKY